MEASCLVGGFVDQINDHNYHIEMIRNNYTTSQ